MEDSKAIYKLDSCKFKPEIKCFKAICPAWAYGMCSFDIGEIAVKKTYDLIQAGLIAWQGLDQKQKINGLAKILRLL